LQLKECICRRLYTLYISINDQHQRSVSLITADDQLTTIKRHHEAANQSHASIFSPANGPHVIGSVHKLTQN